LTFQIVFDEPTTKTECPAQAEKILDDCSTEKQFVGVGLGNEITKVNQRLKFRRYLEPMGYTVDHLQMELGEETLMAREGGRQVTTAGNLNYT
jgi:hypothetical protein